MSLLCPWETKLLDQHGGLCPTCANVGGDLLFVWNDDGSFNHAQSFCEVEQEWLTCPKQCKNHVPNDQKGDSHERTTH